MSDTPRTDLAKFAMPMSWIATTERKQYVVQAETVERMETELAAALTANQRLEKERDEARMQRNQKQTEIKSLQGRLDQLKGLR